MFVKAKKILASELMYAKDLDEDGAAEWLDDVLAQPAAKRTDAHEGQDGCGDRLTGRQPPRRSRRPGDAGPSA